MTNKFETLEKIMEEQEGEITNPWRKERKNLKKPAPETMGPVTKRIRKPWISEEALRSMDRRQKLKRDKNCREEYQQKYHKIEQNLHVNLEQVWINEQCKEAKKHLRRNNTRAAHKNLKQLNKPLTPQQRNSMDKDRKETIGRPDDILQRRQE